MENNHSRILSTVKSGETVKLVKVNAGHRLKNKLASMGILPNSTFVVLRNELPGPFVIKIKESRVLLGRGMAEKITVI